MLEHFFGSKTRLKLLRLFFRSPEQSFFVRELSRITNIQLNAVRREIANLERLTIVQQVPAHEVVSRELEVSGRSKFYRLHRESVLYPELNALLLKGEALEEQAFVRDITERGGDIQLFILTGLFTGDSEAPTDMLIVGVVKPVALSKIIRAYEAERGQTLRYTLLSPTEFKDRREIGDKFLYGVFETKHIKVVNKYHIS